MKICSFTSHELEQRYAPKEEGRIRCVPTPMESAMRVLAAALKTVNQAGLHGKKLTDLRVVNTYTPNAHHDDQVIEIHAKVTHRLKSQ